MDFVRNIQALEHIHRFLHDWQVAVATHNNTDFLHGLTSYNAKKGALDLKTVSNAPRRSANSHPLVPHGFPCVPSVAKNAYKLHNNFNIAIK